SDEQGLVPRGVGGGLWTDARHPPAASPVPPRKNRHPVARPGAAVGEVDHPPRLARAPHILVADRACRGAFHRGGGEPAACVGGVSTLHGGAKEQGRSTQRREGGPAQPPFLAAGVPDAFPGLAHARRSSSLESSACAATRRRCSKRSR